jgi:hypothetical protein
MQGHPMADGATLHPASACITSAALSCQPKFHTYQLHRSPVRACAMVMALEAGWLRRCCGTGAVCFELRIVGVCV